MRRPSISASTQVAFNKVLHPHRGVPFLEKAEDMSAQTLLDRRANCTAGIPLWICMLVTAVLYMVPPSRDTNLHVRLVMQGAFDQSVTSRLWSTEKCASRTTGCSPGHWTSIATALPLLVVLHCRQTEKVRNEHPCAAITDDDIVSVFASDSAQEECHDDSVDAPAVMLENARAALRTVLLFFVQQNNISQVNSISIGLQELDACIRMKQTTTVWLTSLLYCFTSGATAGMCDIKEEPQEDSSNEDPSIEVKTEPYNVPVLAGQEQIEHSCDPTSEEFFESMDLQRHKGTNTGEKLYKCNVCPAVFSQSRHLQVHKRTHTGEKPYKCDVCAAEFSLSGNLRQHKRTHTGEKPYKCDFCPAEFSQKGNLQYHKRMHTGEKPYKCDACPAEFSRHEHLQVHKRTHTGEKPFKCHVCLAEFSQKGNLQYHKRTHTGERPYKCDVCPAEFRWNQSLLNHKRTHTGEKPYKCKVCPAEFTRSAEMQCHKRTHTGEKPYKCDICLAEFSRSTDMQHHKRMHTGQKP
ncbi:zinc finger protein 235-like isoform X2 [Ornithodoros turicata]|uniref:zinc finger protein 235-like isoform X2 n=1 Tax=Ornithodoros turicata TaxID=34597 RepID=UPI00313A0EEC